MNDHSPKSQLERVPQNQGESAPPHALQQDAHYHFLGVGGIGMSALAGILHRRGFQVSGSDTHEGGEVLRLRREGIPVTIGHDAKGLREADVVVYSSAIGAEHPIWAEVERRGLPRLHRAEMLGALSAGRRTLAVTGTHGKTTTSAALGHVLHRAGWDPTVFVGGHVGQLDGGSNFLEGSGDWFVCEADESDASFLHLAPHGMLLTNVDEDHLDFHGSLANIQATFASFAHRLPSGGVLVACADNPGAKALASQLATGGAEAPQGVQIVTYGFTPEAQTQVRVTETMPGGMILRVAEGGEDTEFSTPLFGRHNAANLCGVFAMARALGMEREAVTGGLSAFQGVERRQQFIGQAGPWAIYDDYAHHPEEIRATLAGFREALGGPITVVFQPHLYSRTAHFAREFAEALRPAERIFVCEIYGAREAPQPGVTAHLVLEHLSDHPQAAYLPHWEALLPLAHRGELPPGLVLTLGAGDITGLGPLLMKELA